MRSHLGLPPLYTCVICGQEVDIKSPSTVQQALVWVKAGRKSVHRLISTEYKWAHDFCLNITPENEQGLLF